MWFIVGNLVNQLQSVKASRDSRVLSLVTDVLCDMKSVSAAELDCNRFFCI